MTLGLAASLLIGIMAAVMAIVQSQVAVRAEANRPVVPDRAEIVSTAWLTRDVFQVQVRLSRADGAPLRGWHGIRFIDTRSGGFRSFSSRLSGTSDPAGDTKSVDVVATEKLTGVPREALTLQIEGVTALPSPYRSPIERFLFGPDPPRIRSLRYPLSGGSVTLPAPRATLVPKGK